MQGVVAVLGLMVPVLALSVVGFFVLARSRIGEALARRIAGERHDPEFEERILALQEDVALLRGQLQETQERLDFAERLLARPEPEMSPIHEKFHSVFFGSYRIVACNLKNLNVPKLEFIASGCTLVLSDCTCHDE